MTAQSLSKFPVDCSVRRLTHVVTVGVWFSVFGVSTVSAQPLAKQSDLGAYAIPFASESNRIELEVVNSTNDAVKDVAVHVGAVPNWLTFETTSETMGVLKSGETKTATFVFDLDAKAPVGEVAELTIEVVVDGGNEMSPRAERGVPPSPAPPARRDDRRGLLEKRTIRIQPEAPTELTLRGNYPNPFNPTTRIAYALPHDGDVEIGVFNSIGQRVARIVDDIQEAGYQEATWNAAGVPSGVYFYAVTLRASGERRTSFGKMVVMK